MKQKVIACFLIPCSLLILLSGCKSESSSPGSGQNSGAVVSDNGALGSEKTASGPSSGSGGPTQASSDEFFVDGVSAPEFNLPTLTGETRSLKDFRGKLVLLNFWATWCVPCVTEMQSLDRLSKSLGEKGLVVIGINVDNEEQEKDVRQFVQDKGLEFPILLDKSFSVPELYKVTGFPETFCIGPDGKFTGINDAANKNRTVLRVVGDRAWDSKDYIKAVEDVLSKKVIAQ